MISVDTTTKTKVGDITALPLKSMYPNEYKVTIIQRLLDAHALHLRSIKEDLLYAGLVRFTNPSDIAALVLLSNTDKVVLDELINGDIINRLDGLGDISQLELQVNNLETTVANLSTTVDNLADDLVTLEGRVAALETP